jgi:hypothetical protein
MNNFAYTWREPLDSQVDRALRCCEAEVTKLVTETRQKVTGILVSYLQDEFGQSREKLRFNRERADCPAPPRKRAASMEAEEAAPRKSRVA